MMTDVRIGLPSSYKVRSLLDSGAMPTIIADDRVPLGAIVCPTTVTLSGVSNTNISVAGETNLAVELGGNIFSQKFVIVPRNAMIFPQDCKIILGNNFFARHGVGLEPSTWSITHNGLYLSDMLPAWIENTLYSPTRVNSKIKEVTQTAKINATSEQKCLKPVSKVRESSQKTSSAAVHQRRPTACQCVADPEPTPVTPPVPPRPKGQSEGSDTSVPQKPVPEDPYSNLDTPYAVLPCAFYQIKTGTQQIKIRLQHQESPHAIKQDSSNSYVVVSNMFQPGVLVQDTITSGILTVSIRNMNAEPALLSRDIPIAYAYRHASPEEVPRILNEPNGKNLCLADPRAQVILTLTSLSELTEQAFDGKPASESDMLDQFFEYDPADVTGEKVTYDQERFEKVLELLNVDKWELTEDQKAKAMEMVRRKQRAYHLKGEPLSQTHLLKHDIELIDDVIIQNPPRWTPHKLRPPVEKEVEALLKLDLAFRSNHPHSSPIVLVKKKDKNDWRLCCDYRSVNLNSKPQFYPSRSIDENHSFLSS